MDRRQNIKLSVVMPTMNEEGAIAKVINDIKKNTAQYNTEIFIVDSSKDKTPEIAEKLEAKVIRQKPQGHGIAFRTAMKEANGDIVITADCDDTYSMKDIPKFIKLIDEGYDIVSGNRLNKRNKAMPLTNKFGNWLFAFLVRILYGIKTNDVTTGMHAIKREVIHSIPWETNYSVPAELIIRSNLAGYKWQQIDIDYRERIGQVTLNKWRSGKAYLRCIFKYKFNLPISSELL